MRLFALGVPQKTSHQQRPFQNENWLSKENDTYTISRRREDISEVSETNEKRWIYVLFEIPMCLINHIHHEPAQNKHLRNHFK